MTDLTIRELLKRARTRLMAHLALDKGALAVTIGMSGAIFLLLTGTRFLSFFWVALVAAVSLGAGLYRLRKTIPSVYVLAQRIDYRLKTADALSTAVYFSDNPDPARKAICERQQRDAAVTAESVDLRQAIPYKRSRYFAPALALAAVAMGLFAVRYAVTGSISLEPSLLQLALDSFFNNKPLEARNINPNPKGADGQDPNDPAAKDRQEEQNGEPESMLDAKDPSDSGSDLNDDKQGQAGDAEKDGQDNDKQSGDDADASKDGKNGDPQDDQKDNAKEGKQDGKESSKPSYGKENPSMMNKLRDALANMMNKMRSQSKDQQQNSKNQQQQQQQNQDSQQSDQSQSQSVQADINPNDQSQGQNKESADSKSGQRAADRNAAQDSKSGAGNQDGKKDARQAELLEAMGMITAILGKRSANLTGEVLVEVGSTKQQLKTPLQQKDASHAEAGSEIHRDEVPLMYQQFVQKYFEEIHKPAAKPAAAQPATGRN